MVPGHMADEFILKIISNEGIKELFIVVGIKKL